MREVEPLKVSQLIELLKTFDPDLPVAAASYDESTSGLKIGGVTVSDYEWFRYENGELTWRASPHLHIRG